MGGNVFIALGLALLAGLSTGLGGILVLFTKKTNTKFLSFALGFSAGVMIYVSMIEIFNKAQASLTAAMGQKHGAIVTAAAFFGGMIFIALIDRLIPQPEAHIKTDGENCPDRLKRTGVFTALAIAIHNFPEGLATFISAMHDPNLAIPIVVAIAIHNIPEGVAVAAPIYYATNDRRKAFSLSLLSGLAEPMGAIIGYLILLPIMGDLIYGILFAGVAGIMVFISIDELLPSARDYGSPELSILGAVLGMGVMAISLLLFI